MVTAMILAGGVGNRMGKGMPKQYVEILGRPVLSYTVEIYQRHPEVDAIEIVCSDEWRDYVVGFVEEYGFDKVKWIADGGNTFQESTTNGINNLRDKLSDDDILMLHYGASPFTCNEIITDSLRVCRQKGSASSATPCFQLMGTKDGDESLDRVDRDKVVQLNCPHTFRFGYIKGIYDRAAKEGLLEKTSYPTDLIYLFGDAINLSYGNQSNVKLTTSDDLDLFEGYVRMCRAREGKE